MRFNFRKITSVLASAVMLGSTIGIAAAATNYPAPFVAGGASDVGIVVGSSAATSDLYAATELATGLSSELTRQTVTTTSTTSTGASATGGDSVNLATSSQKLYFNSSLDAARSVLSKSELPTLLADGKITDDSGTAYTYTQSIGLGGRVVEYGTSGADFDDPELIIEVGTTAASYLYQYKLTFNKNINVTHSDVRGNDLSILGTPYTIATGSDGAATSPQVVLYGSGSTETLNEGETKTVNVGGTDYEVTLGMVTSTPQASISVDGSAAKKISEDASSKIGDLEIYVKSASYSAKEGTTNTATLVLGTKKLTLTDGATVKEGSDDVPITGTKVRVGTSGGKVSAVEINVTMQKSTKDYIKAGDSFTDPVFGNLKVQFASATPALDDETRDTVSVFTDNSLHAKATFTTDLSGKEYTLTFSKDQDTSESTVTPRLAMAGNKTIHILENASVKENEYMIINSGDYGRIVQMQDIPDSPVATSTIQLVDAVTGENVLGSSGLTVGLAGQATTNINGQPYYFDLDHKSNNSVMITWGSGAGYSNPGSATTLAPRIKLKNGEWLSVIDQTTLTNATTYALPGVETLSTYEGGSAVTWTCASNGVQYYTKTYGNLNYTIQVTCNTANTTGYLVGIDTTNAALDGSGYVPFNSTYGPAIILIEEKKSTESGNADNGDAIIIGTDKSGSTTPVKISIAEPKATGIWGSGTSAKDSLASLSSDSYKKRALTRYGSYIEYTSLENDAVTVQYPNEQMYVDLLFTSPEAEVTPGTTTTTGGTGGQDLGNPVVQDTEINKVKSNNLIVVGGSCVNSVAAEILGVASPTCGEAFTTATGVGPTQFLVKVVESPYATDKIAMLIAGYEAADTTTAVKYVIKNKVSTEKNTTETKDTGTALV